MVAAFLLIESGEHPAEAIRKLRHARPGAIETPAQEMYVVMGYKRLGEEN